MTELDRFPDKQTFLRYQDRLKIAWQQYMSGDSALPDRSVVPFRVAESWKRSKGYGLDPFHYQTYVKMKNLSVKSREQLLLTDKMANYWLGNAAKRYEFDLSIFDAQGNNVALESKGSLGISFANEMVLGTNATALALLEDRPGYILAEEHFSRFFHQRFCAAAPFHSPERDVVGAICISALEFDTIRALGSVAEQFARMCTLVFSLAHQTPGDGNEELRVILEHLANLYAPMQCIDGPEETLPIGQQIQRLQAMFRKSTPVPPIPAEGAQPRQEDAGGPRAEPGSGHGWNTFFSQRPERQCDTEFSDIIGDTPQLLKCIRFAKQAALTDFPIVLNGETGSGKEIFAQAIHNASARRNEPFIAVNCGAITPSLVESELFGYEEGAFTDAVRQGRSGLLEQSSGGTLFLDEVESMPLEMQARLLRVLSNGTLTRVGSTAEVPVDLRIISASKVDLRKAAEQGRFREDLFYRISSVSLDIPPLRERKEDIPQLCRHFLRSYGGHAVQITPDAMQRLCAYNWPGNVRELENVLTHACIFSREGLITPDCLPEELGHSGVIASITRFLTARQLLTPDYTATIAELEAALIQSALEENQFVLKRAAQALHIDRKTLQAKIKRYPELAALKPSVSSAPESC